ncbi:MAG: HPr(Ser) kinase/phosphatase [candidate division WOR-3 bacterium]
MAKIKEITVKTIYEEKREDLKLKLISGEEGLNRKVKVIDINRPGLALAGYTEHFPQDRIQIIGRTESSYLGTKSKEERREAIRKLFSFSPPAFILTAPAKTFSEFRQKEIPIFKSQLPTLHLIHKLTTYLDYKLAPETYIHGDLVDIYGIGILIVGRSGIGKSECALDLVARGHRLVADDLVKVLRRGEGVIMGYSAARSEKLRHHIELRGVGIVDIYSLFGVRAIRIQKRIEVVCELVPFRKGMEIERIGLEDKFTKILGVKIPLVRVPVIPGKNLALVCEVIAKNHLAKILGYHPAKTFYEEISRIMEGKPTIDRGITEDIE